MKLESYPPNGVPFRVLLEEKPEGVYVFVFEQPESQFPEKDWLQDDWDMAKRACLQDFGIQEKQWNPIGDSKPPDRGITKR